MRPPAVLHVTSVLGGGVDRHVRDIARASQGRHVIWHTADGADVVEVAGGNEPVALDPASIDRDGATLAAWLRSQRVGLVHVHSVSEAARTRAAWAATALGVATIVTLHDILFLRANGFEPGAGAQAHPAWLARTAPFLRDAAAVIAPSDYIARLARENVPGLEVTIVPNGSSRALQRGKACPGSPEADGPGSDPRPEFLARRPAHVAAVLGAIGPHKGSAILDGLSANLEGTGIAVVIVGYLDMQVIPGWRGRHVFVHGAYGDDEVGALIRGYGAEIALFPNQVPESFSYALSDAWNAGLPALVPREGALGERVERYGGGWFLPEGFGVAQVASELRRIFSPAGASERARVKSRLSTPDPGRVPSLEEMTRSLDALYERFGIDPAAPAGGTPELSALLAKNLDGALFRQELVRLADEFVQLRTALEHERGEAARFKSDATQWIAKLEADIAAVQADVSREVEARRALGQENVQLQIHKDAFDLLPEVIRKMLLKKILNARS
ncbi:MAG: glycosyltransferase family 4 protein [Usitatibacter sp.]